MNHLCRLILLSMALIVGGGLGYILLPEVEPIKIIVFLIACFALGEAFHQIDKRLFRK